MLPKKFELFIQLKPVTFSLLLNLLGEMINRDDLMTSDVNQPYDPDLYICRYDLYTSDRVMDQ